MFANIAKEVLRQNVTFGRTPIQPTRKINIAKLIQSNSLASELVKTTADAQNQNSLRVVVGIKWNSQTPKRSLKLAKPPFNRLSLRDKCLIETEESFSLHWISRQSASSL